MFHGPYHDDLVTCGMSISARGRHNRNYMIGTVKHSRRPSCIYRGLTTQLIGSNDGGVEPKLGCGDTIACTVHTVHPIFPVSHVEVFIFNVCSAYVRLNTVIVHHTSIPSLVHLVPQYRYSTEPSVQEHGKKVGKT